MLLSFRSLLICLWPLLVIASDSGAMQTASKTTPQSAPHTVTITDTDNGKDVDLTTGQTLIVKLKGNPSTGYAWSVSGDPAPLQLRKSSHERNKSGMAGAPQMSVLQFSAASAGLANLELIYHRPWEYSAKPAKTFRIRVNVR